jgi:hypothetical protein
MRETRQWLPLPLTYEMIRGRLKHRFRARSYREFADDRLDVVAAFRRDLLDRATGD